MQESIKRIVEKVNFEQKPRFSSFLNKCMKISWDSATNVYSSHENVLFITDVFFEGLSKFSNSLPKDVKISRGVETLLIIFEELGFDIEPEEAFIFFHLRDLGKFKIKEDKLKNELKSLWGIHKDHFLDDSDYKGALKNLIRANLIEYRKGTIGMSKEIIIIYKR